MSEALTVAEFGQLLAAFAAMISLVLGLFWFIQKQFLAIRKDAVDRHAAAVREISDLKLHVAETYLPRLFFERFEMRFNQRLDRFEGRLDKYFEEHASQ